MRKTDFVSDALVIGLGEIGTPIANILDCDAIDKEEIAPQNTYNFLHICIPFNENFIEIVKDYKEKYKPNYILIHSTVPIGTSRLLNAVHSPVRGIHPHLEEGIRTFVKYFGGQNAYICAGPFIKKGIKIECGSIPEETEALKLWDTTIYGLNILIEKEIHKFCQENSLDFDFIYKDANKTYNEGYAKLGFPQFSKYILEHREEEKIGGHCILENARLLDNRLAKLLL